MSEARAALLLLHGMGETRSEYGHDLLNALQKRLGDGWTRLHCESPYYQDILQEDEESYWSRVNESYNTDVWKGTLWRKMRSFVMSGFSDVAMLSYKPYRDNSVYTRVQNIIRNALLRSWEALGRQEGPVVVVAQSLGGLVLSNYLWDAHKEGGASYGVWKSPFDEVEPACRDFCRLTSLRTLLTTGCNIPIFISGMAAPKPFPRPHPDFQWRNYFDIDDPLGWPLRLLAQEYDGLVEDLEINAKGSTVQEFLLSATPLSHNQYWTTPEFLDDLEATLRRLLD